MKSMWIEIMNQDGEYKGEYEPWEYIQDVDMEDFYFVFNDNGYDQSVEDSGTKWLDGIKHSHKRKLLEFILSE